jgi:CHAD domain-containing protein
MPGSATTTDVKASGDRLWSEAGAATLAELAATVRKRAKDIGRKVEIDPVHDMRTATRRLRTAITIYGHDADRDDRTAVEDELRRVTRRLGAVRDLDVLLETLAAASTSAGGGLAADDLEPLRRAWKDERVVAANRLQAELERKRFDRALDGAEQLGKALTDETGEGSGRVVRIAHRAPGLIWSGFGEVLVYEIDPTTADPAVIHEMRIAAKKLRYTLETFEDALEPGASLIQDVTALQDAAGEMHDAIVARDRARELIGADDLRTSQGAGIEAYAEGQELRAEAQRPVTARCLAIVRSRAFRASLSRAVAGMGHVVPGRDARARGRDPR